MNQKEERAIDTPIQKEEGREHSSYWSIVIIKARQALIIMDPHAGGEECFLLRAQFSLGIIL